MKKFIATIMFTFTFIMIIILLQINKKTVTTIKNSSIRKFETNIEVTGYTDEVLMNPGKEFIRVGRCRM